MNTTAENKVGTFSQILLWFGASVSIAEIITGTLIAPLGLSQGLLSIIIGHVIGGVILYLAGFIGAQSGLSASWSARISFGKYGSYGFSIINILQLIGWTAIMIITAAKSMDGVTSELWGFANEWFWCVVIGILICVWVLLGNNNLLKVNTVVMFLLLAFSLMLGFVVFNNTGKLHSMDETISFGAAVELNVAMSLSWLPLISDYTRNLKNPKSGTFGSVAGYFFGSLLMYSIGLGAALFAGTSDFVAILLSAGLGVVALVIVIFSTVTTTFLDVYSAGVSIENISTKVSGKSVAIVACAIGTLLAVFVSMSQYENFLYLIGSAFAPLFAILFAEYYIVKKREVNQACKLNIKNIILWVVGFIAYRLLMPYATIIGITLPVMIGIGLISVLLNRRKNDK